MSKLKTITNNLQAITDEVTEQGNESLSIASDIYDMLETISFQLERIANAVEKEDT